MNPVIDGRRANCNLACLGASKPRPPTSPKHGGTGRFRSPGGIGLVAPSPNFGGSSSSSSSSAFVHHHQQQLQQHHTGQFPFPYSAYGFSGYAQEGMYPMNYYNHHLCGGQQYSPYIGPSSTGTTGIFHGFYPYYAQYNAAQNSNQAQAQAQAQQHHQGFSFQYTTPPPPPLLQYPYLPHHHHQQFNSQPPPPPILSLPTSLALSLASSSSSSTSTSAATTATKSVIITTKAMNVAAEASCKKDGHEANSSTIKIED